MSDPYVSELKTYAKHNANFRQVLFTSKHMQLVVMCLQPGEEIGTEVHEVDQLIYVVDGEGRAVLDGQTEKVKKGIVMCVPAGVQHNVICADGEALKLFTVYGPPQHAPGTVHQTRADAEANPLEAAATEA
jgi:mannose-6-phosphate isomerase-like protein (cupin superfamily)